MAVAGVLIALGFRRGHQDRGWWTAVIGSGLLVVLGLAVFVPCLAYTIAALCTWLRRAV